MTDIPDVLEVAKSGYELLLENKKVRVMEIKLKPGEKSPMHNHPNDHVIYVVKDAKFKLGFPNGKSDVSVSYTHLKLNLYNQDLEKNILSNFIL